MDRISDQQLRVIKVAIVLFGAAGVVFYSYAVGDQLYEMRHHNSTNTVLESMGIELEKGKNHHQPYQLLSFIATCLIMVVLVHIGLVVGVAKNCRILLKLWLVVAAGLCFMGVYLTILNTFGTYNPLYGTGVLYFFSTMLYVFFMGLVWIYHERGEDLETVIRTHPLGSHDDLMPDFNN